MFNGMIGDLLSGQIDLILTSLTMALERSQAVQYLPPIGQEKGALFIRSDNTEADFSWWMFADPFTMVLWLMILVVALVNASFISVVNYFYVKSKQVVICNIYNTTFFSLDQLVTKKPHVNHNVLLSF